MNRETQKLTDMHDIKYTKCEIHNTSFLTSPFYMIVLDGEAIGHPVTEEQAKLILGWFESVVFEYNEYEGKWDAF